MKLIRQAGVRHKTWPIFFFIEQREEHQLRPDFTVRAEKAAGPSGGGTAGVSGGAAAAGPSAAAAGPSAAAAGGSESVLLHGEGMVGLLIWFCGLRARLFRWHAFS